MSMQTPFAAEVPEETRRLVEPLLPADSVCRPVGNEIDKIISDGDFLDMYAYDPFDLADVEIWYNGHYMEQARLLHIQTTVQPGVTPDPAPPQAAPSTGVDYLAMLRQEYEQLLREQLPPIPFKLLAADSAPSDSGW